MVSEQHSFPIHTLSSLDPETIGFHPLIQCHLAWLAEANTRHNLTTVPPEQWISRHVIDSIAPLLAGWSVGGTLLDLGTGAGFPGMPISFQAEISRFTLLDSKRKVVDELNGFLAREGGLADRGQALSERAEELGHQTGYRESFDRVVVRAVDSLPVLIELGIPFLNPAGELWCWKSGLEEISCAAHALGEMQASVLRVLSYRLPGEAIDRHIVAIGRTGEVPVKYPRRTGIPHKRPL